MLNTNPSGLSQEVTEETSEAGQFYPQQENNESIQGIHYGKDIVCMT